MRAFTPLLLLSAATFGVSQNEADLWPQNAADATQGQDRYNYTLEIRFETKIVNHLSLYIYNISVGTPPQSVPVAIDITSSDVIISNETLRIDEDGTLTTIDFYGYDPNRSSSSVQNFDTIIMTNQSAVPDLGDSITPVLNSTYLYTSDNYTTGGLAVAASLSFISSTLWTPFAGEFDRITRQIPSYWHSIGLGLAESSVVSLDRARENSSVGPYGGVLDDLRYGVGAIRSKSYSLWLDAPEKQSGHLLLGGLDTEAFTGSLVSLNTTLSAFKRYTADVPALMVNSHITSVSTDGQNPRILGLPVGRTVLSSQALIELPTQSAVAIWEALGADYKVTNESRYSRFSEVNRLSFATPVVPCSYLTNTTTLNIQFEAQSSDFYVAVPISDLTKRVESTTGNGTQSEVCALTIVATLGNFNPGLIFLGTPVLKHLYQVYDLDNKVISLATPNPKAISRNILPIPEDGGIAAMGLGSPPTTTTTTTSTLHSASPTSGAPHRRSGPGNLILIVSIAALLFLF